MKVRAGIRIVVSLLLPIGGIAPQENPSSDVRQKLQTLQGEFDQWQQTLVAIHFEESTLDQRWLSLLNQERSTCLETMKAANQQITAVESEKAEGPRLAQEFLLADDLSRLSDHLLNLLHLVTSSFGVSPPAASAASGHEPPSFKWQRDLGSMVNPIQPVRGILRSEIYNKLQAIGQNSRAEAPIPASPPIQPGPLGQISGHIYRADTGAPLAKVIVTLSRSPSGNELSRRSVDDGSYQFPDLAPGTYCLSAYRTGFVGQVYAKNEPKTAGGCPPSCVALNGGQKLDGIDLRLSANPSIAQLSEDGFSLAYSEKPLHLQFGPGGFSPDGRFFAIAVAVAGKALGGHTQLWLYDMHSHRLTPVTEGPGGALLEYAIRNWVWSGDDTLYLSGSLIRHRVGHQAYVAVTTAGAAKEIVEIPPQVAATFQEDEALGSSSSSLGAGAHNDQYFLISQRLCRGCSDTLSERPRKGGATRVIAQIDRNFTFDGESSLVFYPQRSCNGAASIVIFDLKTWQPQEFALPVFPEFLFDQTHDGAGHLLAYLVQGSCEPDASSEEAESQLLVPGNPNLRRGQSRSPHVCFVKLP